MLRLHEDRALFHPNENIMKNVILFFLFLLPFASYAQGPVIECPEDLTVSLLVLDTDYESYGDPSVVSSNSYTLDTSFIRYNSGCNENYTEIIYTATEPNGLSAECTQTIEIINPELEDFTFPADAELSGVGLDEAGPDYTGYPEPYEFLQGASPIVSTYEDTVIPVGQTSIAKIVRTWTLLDWCTANTATHNQIIEIEDFREFENGVVMQIPTCNGGEVNIFEVRITTNDPNVTIDASACNLTNSELGKFVNCVVENNPIGQQYEYTIALEGPDDYLNGVSTLDMVIIQRHILGVNVFTDLCVTQAADVTNDGYVSALDLLMMRRLILGVDGAFSNAPSWKIYIENAVDVNGANVNSFSIAADRFPLQELDVRAIKTGDVNNTALNN